MRLSGLLAPGETIPHQRKQPDSGEHERQRTRLWGVNEPSVSACKCAGKVGRTDDGGFASVPQENACSTGDQVDRNGFGTYSDEKTIPGEGAEQGPSGKDVLERPA